MSFSYDFDTAPLIAYPRLLIPDRIENPALGLPYFSDQEISAFYVIQQMQFQSSMFFSPPAGRNLPPAPISVFRIAAIGLDIIANDNAQASIVVQLMDIKLNGKSSSEAVSAQADKYRRIDDESGAMAVIEQCFTGWGTQDRFFKQIQRMQGGGSIA